MSRASIDLTSLILVEIKLWLLFKPLLKVIKMPSERSQMKKIRFLETGQLIDLGYSMAARVKGGFRVIKMLMR